MKIIEHVRNIAEKVGKKISDICDTTTLRELAKKSGFVKRSTSRTEGEDFVRLMTTEILGEETVSAEGLCDILRQINPKADMSPQALNERIGREEAVRYLREVFELAVGENLAPAKSAVSPEILSPFGSVLLEDSTQIILHEKLADEFRGSGGSASRSALKIDLTYDAKQDALRKILISDGNVPDQSRADEILTGIQENDLILRDLGYFSVSSLREIGTKNAFFLSRLPKSVSVFLSDDKNASAANLPKHIGMKFGNLPVSDMTVRIGDKERLPCRLIAYRLPDEVVSERRRKAHISARKKGRQPSSEYLNWLRFGFYVTNVPEKIWEAEVVGTVYRLRWQIELTFRNWKSLMNIHILRGTRKERVECFLYGRLISVVVATMICGFASWYAFNYLKKEVSFHKVISWLRRKDRLAMAIRSENLSELFDDLIRNISKSLCKQKRKRKTTHQLLEERIPYMDSFPSDTHEMIIHIEFNIKISLA